MRRSLVLLVALSVAVALLVPPSRTASQSAPADEAARNLLATSYTDAILNPAQGEDTEFFINRGGVPNVMFVLDTSPTMQRLPPNGPPSYATALPPEDVIGCGLEGTASSLNVQFMASSLVQEMNSRRFNTACGLAVDGDLVHGKAYQGHYGATSPTTSVATGYDYAKEASVCPHYTTSETFQTGDYGFDPDYYDKTQTLAASTGSKSLFFARDAVFHDTVGTGTTWSSTNPLGDGWRYSGTFPFTTSKGPATIDDFCQAKWSNDPGKAKTCNDCLAQKGWYYDGVLVAGADGKQYPSVWYTGNYLNFFPPKFVIVRKVVKDIVASLSKVRMAYATLGAKGWTLQKEFNPSCDHPDSNFDSNRSTYVKLVDSSTQSPTATSKPLAKALFDVGRFYHSPGLPWFGGTFESGDESQANVNQYAVCYSCQTSSVILLTDGYSTSDDTGLPTGSASKAVADSGVYAGDTSTGMAIAAADCPECNLNSDWRDNLVKVAWYMHHFDLRDNAEGTRDCQMNGGKQTLDLYTVGFRTASDASATAVLAAAAKAGGGSFVSADQASLLRDGIVDVFNEISNRSTSFSVATVSTLQTSAGHSVIVPRFDPDLASFWQGHLYRYELYSEFVNTCTGASSSATSPACCTPGGAGDLDCDDSCSSVFLMDSGSKFIQEGGDGVFYRNTPDTAACAQSSCSTCGNASGAVAQPWWDAGATLAKTSWKSRKVYTVVDSYADGRIDSRDTMFQLQPTDTAAQKILPYLGVGSGGVCGRIADAIATGGNGQLNAILLAAAVRNLPLSCAKTVIRWILGADIFNEAGSKTGWPADPDNLPDRAFKLGDVFHSSPVVVDPPLPADGILCPNGLHNQCLTALWKTPTAQSSANAYQEYATSSTYKHRRKVILVGANDGLLHAFNGGNWHAGDDPLTSGIDESVAPFDGYYDRSFDPNGPSDQLRAEELWAFLPPDLISKIPLIMTNQHELFVDGTAMVRDVWVDGTTNALSTSESLDDKKQPQEFHTIAIVGERRGGTHYFALDVTEATRKASESGFKAPSFLWIYPQPDSARSLEMGETYSDFLPVAPPIGPVRIKDDSASQTALGLSTPKDWTLSMSVTDASGTAQTVKYHERWVTMLSGGYDPQYLRGRGVHMVDVWSGKEVFDFSYPANSSSVTDSADPRLALRYPIPATVAMVAWGGSVAREDKLGFGNQGFFDTATFGDTGGQLWVLRFHDPAALDASNGYLASNWFGARAFQMGSTSNASLKNGYPFFYITANTALPGTYTFRTYLGTGDRYNLLDSYGGTCGPDNIRACVQRGCSASLDLTGNAITAPDLGTLSGALSQTSTGTLATSSSSSSTASSSVLGKAKIVITCPTATTDLTTSTKNVSLQCTKDASGDAFDGYWSCSTGSLAYGSEIPTSNTIAMRNWYFSVRVFDDQRPPFRTLATAKSYDANRLWLNDASGTVTNSTGIVVIDGSSNAPATLADKSSPGWAIYYNHDGNVTSDGVTYTVNKLDERTSSVSSLYRYLTWNSTQRTLAVASATTCDTSKCVQEGRRMAYHYGADPITGGVVLTDKSGNAVRAIKGNTLVPAQGDQATVFVNQKGQIQVGLVVINPEKGATNVGQTDAVDPVRHAGYLEVNTTTHACRHAADEATAAAVCK